MKLANELEKEKLSMIQRNNLSEKKAGMCSSSRGIYPKIIKIKNRAFPVMGKPCFHLAVMLSITFNGDDAHGHLVRRL
ncbi:hypothetical protein QF049_003145 [Paenibacillus sp. W4I10]|nr:hypothetical protein [Paenibacillus sp. W4I10]